GLPDFGDHIQVEIGGQHLILVPRSLRDDLAARIAEVAGAIELADVPRRLDADAIDCAYEVAIGDRVRGLLQFPEILAEAGDCGRRIEYDLGAVQPERAGAVGEVTVVADIDSAGGQPNAG